MAGNIKGLYLFTKRVKNCTSEKEEEQCVEKELAKIRKYFTDKGISPYDRKKCVWKLIYINVLGYNVEFGHSEALNLITSSKYTEKVAGYMALSTLFNE